MNRSTRLRVPFLGGIPAEWVRRIAQDWRAPRHYRDTLRRLFGGDFSDLTCAERQDKVDHVVQMGATAAMVLAAMPLPCLDLTVHAAMVKAIAKVHGVKGGERAMLWRLAAALGLGFILREGLRFVPVAGGLTRMSRAYGAAWALGQAADLYFGHLARGEAPPERESARRLFSATLQRKAREQAAHPAALGALERLRGLNAREDSRGMGDSALRRRMEAALLGGRLT